MKKTILVIIAFVFSINIYAQRTSDVDGSKDYPLITRLHGSFIEF